jgi:hypothetical protein
MVELSAPASSTASRTTVSLMLPTLLLETVLPARSAGPAMPLSALVTTAPMSAAVSPVEATAALTMRMGRFSAATMSERVFEKPNW